MFNSAIGERAIKINGKEFVFKPSFRAICEIESMTGEGVSSVLVDIAMKRIKHSSIVTCLYSCYIAGLKSGEAKISYNEFGDMCMEHGISELIHPTLDLLQNVLSGGSKKKEEAVTEK